MDIEIGFSPCPNDTFIFDALVNKKIDTQGFNFIPFLEDVQTLNQWALQQKLAVTKISYGVLPLIKNNYTLLNSGGALGKGVGPLVISKKDISNSSFANLAAMLQNSTVAIPGENTTAHFLFNRAFKQVKEKKFMVFHQIEEAVLNEMVDAGVIIHENRFTYQQKGLFKIIDLGDYWEQQTGFPIPLGGIVAHKNLPTEMIHTINILIKQSLEFAFKNYPTLSTYVTNNAQEMSEEVMRKHINLYVNNYSLDLGTDGRQAVEFLLQQNNL